MTTSPTWSAVDSPTADLLTLISRTDDPSVDIEWEIFRGVLSATAYLHDGRLDPNTYREQLRGVVAPRRIGAFVNKALAEGLIESAGEWVVSNDTKGHNAGRPVRVYAWKGES